MADDRAGRDKQADDEDRRQRERDVEEALDRGDEPRPPQDDTGDRFGDLDDALEAHTYPTTTDELIEAHGDREVESRDGRRSVADLLTPVGEETFDSADDVRTRIRTRIHRD